MAKFKIATPAGASFTVAGGGYDYEMEPLEGIDAEIVEGPTDEDGFIKFAADADAIYAKGIRITKKIIDGLPEKCRAIVLGSVGVDSVDVVAATARGMPVTNCPDTFIEEVADHAMMLLLARLAARIEQDRMVREGRWREGRPALLKIPRLMGQTLGLIAFGHVARAVAKRAKPFGLRVIAYDPFIEELVMVEHGVLPCTLEEVLSQSDFVSMHAPATPEAEGMLMEKHFRQMKKTAIFINTGRGPTVQEAGLIKALQKAGSRMPAWTCWRSSRRQQQPDPRHAECHPECPHGIGFARFDPARKRHVGRELALVLNGKWPMSCVNPAVLMNSELRRWQPVSMERGPNS